MKLKDVARDVPDEVWEVFEPLLPPRIWFGIGRRPLSNRVCLHALLYVLVSGITWELLPPGFPSYKTVQRRWRLWSEQACFRLAWHQLAERYQVTQGINWDQLLLDGSKKPAKKGGQQTGPSPVDRGKCGTALQLACDARAMPLGALVTSANTNDGTQTEHLLNALVVTPPSANALPPETDPRSFPNAQGDGAYGNRPARGRAQAAGFRLQAPSRGQRLPGVGKVRQAVERCHNFFAQFGRIARRFDRLASRFLGWIELAACLIFIRSGFVR